MQDTIKNDILDLHISRSRSCNVGTRIDVPLVLARASYVVAWCCE